MGQAFSTAKMLDRPVAVSPETQDVEAIPPLIQEIIQRFRKDLAFYGLAPNPHRILTELEFCHVPIFRIKEPQGEFAQSQARPHTTLTANTGRR